MPPQKPSPSPQESIQQVLACFDAYARARRARDSLLPAGRVSPREEERVFDELRRAIERLRNSTR
ncbi:hypothetical protein [Streptomyces sp. NPDC018610]|uniref:hypothetical protein n=1 Tax=Streptomyces sp. NPDC018610 TaxID=3365049 RepID=UPI0037B6D606